MPHHCKVGHLSAWDLLKCEAHRNLLIKLRVQGLKQWDYNSPKHLRPELSSRETGENTNDQ
jgi:hypothetical protein